MNDPYEEYDKAFEDAYIASLEDDLDFIESMVMDSVVEAADGCEVEPDGKCCHGYSSPLLLLGII